MSTGLFAPWEREITTLLQTRDEKPFTLGDKHVQND